MLKLVSYSTARPEDIEGELSNPGNRKKSINMLLSKHVLENTLLKSERLLDSKISSFDVVLCTGDGELDQTYQFFKDLSLNDKARPIFFQNSLHSSTLGSLSLDVKGIRAGYTVSNGLISAETGLELALSLNSNIPIVVIGVDAYKNGSFDYKSKIITNEVNLISGATAALFLGKKSHFFERANNITISDVLITKDENAKELEVEEGYPANGIEKFVNLSKNESGILNIFRPEGHIVRYTLNDEL